MDRPKFSTGSSAPAPPCHVLTWGPIQGPSFTWRDPALQAQAAAPPGPPASTKQHWELLPILTTMPGGQEMPSSISPGEKSS